jgi:putative endonuclease
MAYYAYMLASRKDGAIYIGVTNDIVRRVYEHRIKAVPGFTSKYNITQLVGSRFTTTRLPLISERKNLRNGSGAGRCN